MITQTILTQMCLPIIYSVVCSSLDEPRLFKQCLNFYLEYNLLATRCFTEVLIYIFWFKSHYYETNSVWFLLQLKWKKKSPVNIERLVELISLYLQNHIFKKLRTENDFQKFHNKFVVEIFDFEYKINSLTVFFLTCWIQFKVHEWNDPFFKKPFFQVFCGP